MDVDGAQNSVALWDSLRDLQDKSLTPRRYQLPTKASPDD